MNLRVLSILFYLLTLSSSGMAIAIDDFHCKIPTCRDFHYGLKNYPRHREYVNICYDTVFSLQAIPQKHGKCIDDKTSKISPPCIFAVAGTIRDCMKQLDDLPRDLAKYYCGHILMKYCSVHVGLDRFPLNTVTAT